MARKRMIDPDFWSDEKLGKCKRDERLLFMGLISNADDDGRGRANSKLLKASIFPYDDDIKAKDIEQMLMNLKGMVFIYVIDGQELYYLPNFSKHQVINKKTESKLPPMPENQEELQLPEYYGSTTTPLLPNRKEVKRKEDNVDSFFDTVWDMYPRKEGKGQVSDTQKQKLFQIGLEQMTRCIERYKTVKAGTEKKYLQMGSTFFNSGYVDYLDGNYKEEKPPGRPHMEIIRAPDDFEGG